MKILYGVQGTGHGHISRARVMLPKLREFAEVDVLISGYNYKLNLEGEINFKSRGLSLVYDNRGRIDMLRTVCGLNPIQFMRDVNSVPINDYDFVVNDFEPVSAWAALRADIPCVAISHQASFLSSKPPRPAKKSIIAEQVLKYFAPSTAAVSSHYLRYDDFIEPPIIRRQVRELNPSLGEHITVYLPAFSHEKLVQLFSKIKKIEWHIFSQNCEIICQMGNVKIYPLGKDTFLQSIQTCLGIISSTGFETTSEAMFLGKKLLTIPIKNQYEQLCNAAALKKMGACVVYQIEEDFTETVNAWIDKGEILYLPEISDENILVQQVIDAGKVSHKYINV